MFLRLTPSKATFIPSGDGKYRRCLLISQYIQDKLALRNDQVYNNIMRYGNTTAASIPIAMSEAWAEGKIKENDLICLAAFGSGFTWASALIRW